MKKLLISDYDNTLYTDKETLLDNVKKIKKFREDGNIFVISTSRGYISIKKEIDEYNIPYDYVCVNNGAGILDNKGNLIYVNHMNLEDLEKIENQLEDLENVEITRYYLDDIKTEDRHEKDIDDNKIKSLDGILGYKIKGNIQKLQFLGEKFEKIVPNFELLIKDDKKLFLNNPNNSKEKAVEELINLENLNNVSICTVGDDDVDFNMIKQYDGYRMFNSSKLLEANIRKITLSVGDLISKL